MEWKTIIGLEVHVELATKTKIFCSCTTKFGGEPNTHCCPVCVGMPGTLPVLNEKVLEYAVKAGIALNCDITKFNKFDRKNYFYPDLPKAYQISQLYLPFAKNGCVDIGNGKTIRIHEIHMEEDAGKLTHSETENKTYIDYNRCGVPLLEIVTEPDFNTTKEVIAFLEQLKRTFEYLKISDVKMEEGSMRVDVNLSVMPKNSLRLGTRTEMKNINSFKAIERAIAFETERQVTLLEANQSILQETRRWDDGAGKSLAMRTKENAQDYRYFPEPDIPPIRIDSEFVKHIKDEIPELAHEKKKRYCSEYGLTEYEAFLLTINRNFAILFERTVDICNEPKEVANWMLGAMLYLMNEKNITYETLKISPKIFAEFIDVIKRKIINKNIGKDVLSLIFDCDDGFDIYEYIKQNGLELIDDSERIINTVKQVLSENPKTVNDYKAGKTKAIGFLIGKTMKMLNGKANPETVNKIVLNELSAI